MANEQKNNTKPTTTTAPTTGEKTAAPAAAKASKGKAYITKVILYKNDGTRVSAGAKIYENELAPGSAAGLIERGALADPDAPIAPSQASAQLAHETLAQVAIDGGLITASAGTFAFGEREISGDFSALVAAISIDELRAAIVAGLKK